MNTAPQPDRDPAPILIEVLRGDLVESRHRGTAVIADAAGRVVRSWGEVEQPIYARSAVKPIQALPLVESGAADRYGLGDAELALACASHHGQAVHVEAVTTWLDRIGLGHDDLECGAHLPSDPDAARALLSSGAAPCPVHNNCSGKHTGFLATARHLGEATRHYIDADHPVQRRVAQALGDMTGLDLARAPRGRDGCGIPVIGTSLKGLARAFARLADPSGLPDERRAAATRLTAAMVAKPIMIDGSTGQCHAVMSVAGAGIRLKGGAEGVYCAALPGQGLGVALKIEDGAGRAAQLAMAVLLDRLGCFDEAQRQALSPFLRPVLTNIAGVAVGALRPTPALTV